MRRQSPEGATQEDSAFESAIKLENSRFRAAKGILAGLFRFSLMKTPPGESAKKAARG